MMEKVRRRLSGISPSFSLLQKGITSSNSGEERLCDEREQKKKLK